MNSAITDKELDAIRGKDGKLIKPVAYRKNSDTIGTGKKRQKLNKNDFIDYAHSVMWKQGTQEGDMGLSREEILEQFNKQNKGKAPEFRKFDYSTWGDDSNSWRRTPKNSVGTPYIFTNNYNRQENRDSNKTFYLYPDEMFKWRGTTSPITPRKVFLNQRKHQKWWKEVKNRMALRNKSSNKKFKQ